MPGGDVDVGAKKGKRRTDWGWITVGVALVGMGVPFDLGPSTSRNGQFDRFDLVPAGLYALGLAAIGVGLF